ncbi:hypothetical protein NQL31_000687 [Lotmaria passim]
MSAELECGSEAVGRYTCKFAPKPSVCCANGCCAIDPAGSKTHKPMQLWVRALITFSVAVGMVLIFLLLQCRDRRGARAYKRFIALQQARAAAEQQRQEAEQQPEQQPSDQVEGAASAAADDHEPTESRRE